MAGHGSNSGGSTDALPTNQPASQPAGQRGRQTDRLGALFRTVIDAPGLTAFAIITVLLSEGSPLRALMLIVGALEAGSRRDRSVVVCSECRLREV